ncbi:MULTISPECIES: hypothetical protein [Parabacteroides]|uniref:Uncharacterized protein n=1 Tax=Parabacteroides goldsteinii dnLKV18 TaxID=1235789 RepID=S0GVA1_9BACT|nr:MULTISPECIES: hypothetical protein [Parabacteroides]EOS19908.1 hypothetical protein C803_00589 [Parabacteroides goldsteinii dnLKV18]KAI4360915.1 hypothetical protein C825_002974 [Parabacteroides sp. ASF519]MBF0765359.1 hypothetical protein [Parabacteroides goldsteinii]MRY03772.1 hypothetical protein [Parabacteroides goldsteinii]MRY30270.1 hypothetical protein [Parabacteroides goldsteinii]
MRCWIRLNNILFICPLFDQWILCRWNLYLAILSDIAGLAGNLFLILNYMPASYNTIE